MSDNVVTYDQRVAKIKTANDVDTQIRLAKQYWEKKQRWANAAGNFSEKIERMKVVRAAHEVLKQFRANYFDLKEMPYAAVNTALTEVKQEGPTGLGLTF